MHALDEAVDEARDLLVRERLAVEEAGLEAVDGLLGAVLHEAGEARLEGHDLHERQHRLRVRAGRLEALSSTVGWAGASESPSTRPFFAGCVRVRLRASVCLSVSVCTYLRTWAMSSL